MITVAQIREHLVDYLASDSAEALDQFDDWLAGASWNMHQHSDPQAQRLVSAVELCLAEYDAGKVEERQLRAQFKDMLREIPFSIPLNTKNQITVSSNSSTDFNSLQWMISPVDTLLSAASASPAHR
jgi:hypothetical protein